MYGGLKGAGDCRPPPMEALGEEGKKVMDSCVQENDKESEDGSSK